MSKLLKKYIIYIISFYIFWLGILPLLLTNIVTVICKNLSHNSEYEIVIQKPDFKLYFVPVVKFRAQEIHIKDKNSPEELILSNIKTKVRILPLLSGKVHINSFVAEDVFLKKSVKSDAALNRNFFDDIENTGCILKSVSINKLSGIFLSSS